MIRGRKQLNPELQMYALAQEVHTATEQRATLAEKSSRGLQRELGDLEAAVKAATTQAATRAAAAAAQTLAVVQAELKVHHVLRIGYRV